MKAVQQIRPARTEGNSLHELVERILQSTEVQSIARAVTITNNIPCCLPLKADSKAVSAVIEDLLQTVLHFSGEKGVRISAKKYTDVLLVHLRNKNMDNGYTMIEALRTIQPSACQLGGYVDITSQRHEETTIAFSFPNRSQATQAHFMVSAVSPSIYPGL